MADQFAGKNIPRAYNPTKSVGYTVPPGTYVAVVKNVIDPNRGGRLSVWIPQLGGAENDSDNWKTVRYASPFLGSTNTPGEVGLKNTTNTFSATSQTYGFWAVPPDIGNQVLVTFVGTDRTEGFWFACVFADRDTHNMIPGNPGGSPDGDLDTSSIESATLKSIVKSTKDGNFPGAEYNHYKKTTAPITSRKETIHEFLSASYIQQGLTSDIIRGAGRSSSQRDMPSAVYGWSTPGRPKNDPGNMSDKGASPATRDKEIYTRVGGHSFVMDDGDYFGQSQGIRMRTAGGHQLLMDDTAGIFYLINREGSVWLEMTPSGQLNVYSGAGVNIRTRGDFNIHSDKTVRIYGERGINMFSNGKMLLEGKEEIGVTGGGAVNIHGYQKLALISQQGRIVMDSFGNFSVKTKGDATIDSDKKLGLQEGKVTETPLPSSGISIYDHDDTMNTGYVWAVRKRATKSIVNIFPTHEPWNRSGYDAVSNKQIDTSSGPAPTQRYTGGAASTTAAVAGKEVPVVGDPLSDEFLAKYPGVANGLATSLPSKKLPKNNSYTSLSAPSATKPVGTLTIDQLNSMQAGLAYMESGGDPNRDGGDYKQINQLRYAGRYQHGAAALETMGYLKPGSYELYGNKAFDRDDVWTGKNGITDGRAYLNSPGEQEKAQQELTTRNYRQLAASGVIDDKSPPEHVAGMLNVAHLLGAGGAVKWAKTGDGRDANGTTGASYYAAGRYAVQNQISYQ